MATTLIGLPEELVERVKAALRPAQYRFGAVAKLYSATAGGGGWAYTGKWGVASVTTSEDASASCSIQLVSIDTLQVVFQQVLFAEFDFVSSTQYFWHFEGDDRVYGLSFASDTTGSVFSHMLQSNHKQRRQSRVPAPPRPDAARNSVASGAGGAMGAGSAFASGGSAGSGAGTAAGGSLGGSGGGGAGARPGAYSIGGARASVAPAPRPTQPRPAVASATRAKPRRSSDSDSDDEKIVISRPDPKDFKRGFHLDANWVDEIRKLGIDPSDMRNRDVVAELVRIINEFTEQIARGEPGRVAPASRPAPPPPPPPPGRAKQGAPPPPPPPRPSSQRPDSGAVAAPAGGAAAPRAGPPPPPPPPGGIAAAASPTGAAPRAGPPPPPPPPGGIASIVPTAAPRAGPPAPPPPPPPSTAASDAEGAQEGASPSPARANSNPHNDLLAAIRGGVQLKSAAKSNTDSPTDTPKAKLSDFTAAQQQDLIGRLQAAVGARRRALAEDDDSDWSDSD